MAILKTSILATASLGALTIAGPAYAQTSGPAGGDGSEAGETVFTDEGDAARSVQGDEIIVTARRREEDIQAVPVSVQAFSGDQLIRENVRSTIDLQRLTPGVVFNGAGSDFNTTFSIRGQGRATIGTISPSVQSYVNEVPLPSWGAVVPTYDVANVQVLKGPQGTLFGRNTTGGAVLVYSQAPEHNFGGYVSATVGRYDWHEAEGALNLPIIQDKVALRVAGQYRRRDGWIKGGYDYLEDGADINNESFRVSLLLEPTDGIKNTTIYDYYHNDNTSPSLPTSYSSGTGANGEFAFFHFAGAYFNGILAQAQMAGAPIPQFFIDAYTPDVFDCGTSPTCDPDLAIQRTYDDDFKRYYSSIPLFSRAKIQGITNITELDLGALSLKNIFSYRRARIVESADTDGIELKIVDAFAVFRSDDQISDELQLSGSLFDDTLDFLLGGFYLQNKPRGPNAIGFELFNPAVLPREFGPLGNIGDQQNKETTKAVFGSLSQDLGSFAPGLSLNLSGRYTWDSTSVCSVTRQPPTVAPLASYNACVAAANDPVFPTTTPSAEFEKFTWSIGADYQATPDLFFYAVARRGYRAGGLNTPTLGGLFAPLQTFDPQTVTDGEIGMKADYNLGGARGRTNISAFTSKFNDLQLLASGLQPNTDGDGNPLNDPTNTSLNINAGNGVTRGVEVDGYLMPTDNLRLSYGAAYLYGKIKYDVPAAFSPLVDQSSSKFNYTPKFSFTLAADYTVPGVLGGDLNFHVDWYNTGAFRVDFATNPGYDLVNANIELADIGETGLSVQAFVQNLTDERYLLNPQASGGTPGYQTWFPGAPRMWGLRATYRFGD